jgi:glycerol-3-phosphate cytidylyltransferase
MKINNLLEEIFVRKKMIELHFNKREHRFSSSGLRKEVHQKENLKGKINKTQ